MISRLLPRNRRRSLARGVKRQAIPTKFFPNGVRLCKLTVAAKEKRDVGQPAHFSENLNRPHN